MTKTEQYQRSNTIECWCNVTAWESRPKIHGGSFAFKKDCGVVVTCKYHQYKYSFNLKQMPVAGSGLPTHVCGSGHASQGHTRTACVRVPPHPWWMAEDQLLEPSANTSTFRSPRKHFTQNWTKTSPGLQSPSCVKLKATVRLRWNRTPCGARHSNVGSFNVSAQRSAETSNRVHDNVAQQAGWKPCLVTHLWTGCPFCWVIKDS